MIRERKRSEHTPIIFVTAYNDEAQIAKGYSLGAVDFISTPIEPDVLRTKVGVFVDLYQKTETIRQQAAHRVQLAREQAARQVAEKAMRRSALLAEASRLLSRSLDFDATLASLHRAVVPSLADACQLVLYDANKEIWFAPLAPDEVERSAGKRLSSHARIEQVDPRLGRRSSRSGRERSCPVDRSRNRRQCARSGAEEELVQRDRCAADCPRHAARRDRLCAAGLAAAL